jgi:hypothetical protein
VSQFLWEDGHNRVTEKFRSRNVFRWAEIKAIYIITLYKARFNEELRVGGEEIALKLLKEEERYEPVSRPRNPKKKN